MTTTAISSSLCSLRPEVREEDPRRDARAKTGSSRRRGKATRFLSSPCLKIPLPPRCEPPRVSSFGRLTTRSTTGRELSQTRSSWPPSPSSTQKSRRISWITATRFLRLPSLPGHLLPDHRRLFPRRRVRLRHLRGLHRRKSLQSSSIAVPQIIQIAMGPPRLSSLVLMMAARGAPQAQDVRRHLPSRNPHQQTSKGNITWR